MNTINEDQLIVKKINPDNPAEMMITEYLETGEGDGISIIPLKERERNIDSGKSLIIDHIDN